MQITAIITESIIVYVIIIMKMVKNISACSTLVFYQILVRTCVDSICHGHFLRFLPHTPLRVLSGDRVHKRMVSSALGSLAAGCFGYARSDVRFSGSPCQVGCRNCILYLQNKKLRRHNYANNINNNKFIYIRRLYKR